MSASKKFPLMIGGLLLLALVGGFVYVASVPAPLEQETVTRVIDNGRFFNAE